MGFFFFFMQREKIYTCRLNINTLFSVSCSGFLFRKVFPLKSRKGVNPQGTGRVDIHTHPYTTAACAAGVVTKTTDRDSLRYTYNGPRRVRQLALGCESN